MMLNQVSKLNKLIYGSIIVLTFLIYGNTIKNDYAIDDDFVTTTSPETPNLRVEKGIKGIPELFSTHYVESKKQSFGYRPVVLATYAIEYQFFKSNPQISHFINVLIYALTCILLFVVLSKILSNYHIVLPLLITFLFVVHPIHTEVVNNLKSRDELLAFFFGLCSLFLFLKKIELGKWKYLFFAILFFIIALLCKKTAVIFVAIIPITIYFFTTIKLKQVFLYSLLAPFIYITLTVAEKLMLSNSVTLREFAFFENPLFYEPDFLKRIPMAFYTAGYYVKLFVIPHPLSCYYGFKTIPMVNWASIFVWSSLIFHFSIGIYALLKLPKKTVISYGIIIYLVGIFPFINLITPAVGIIAERFVYTASLGFCVGIAYFLLLIFKIDYSNKPANKGHFKLPFKVVAFIILCIFSIKVISRNMVWKDELTLFRNDVSNFENSCNLNYITANALSNKIAHIPGGVERNSLIKEATFHYGETVRLMDEGIKIYPQDYITSNNLGTIYVDIFNDPNHAQPLFKKVIEINPNNEDANYNYGFCYEKRNLPDSAIHWYEKMILKQPEYFSVYVRLHELYYKKQNYAKAIISDKKALSLRPNKVALHINLGNSYIFNRDTLNGLKYFESAAVIPPMDYVLLQNIANVFRTTGDNSKALYYENQSKIAMKFE
jgi:tetratricopeptide (TPR) repeat protein